MATNLRSFYDTYLAALNSGDAALFLGAGMSRSSGFVDWRGLLRDIAEDIGLDVEQETDLIAVAQYHLNSKRNRARLNQKIIEEFTRGATSTANHRLIATLPIDTVWTTNYDTLIENAFKDVQKRADVKSTQANLSQFTPHRDVTIYKMHGDVSQPQDAVLTKDDYETYAHPGKRGLFIEKLQGDLVSKTFLFVGFSFTDPNIDYVLSRLRVFLEQNPREHFCIMRRPQRPSSFRGKKKAQYEYETTKHELRAADLKRYGITPLDIDSYSEITDILTELNNRGHRRDIFVSGSAYDFDPLGRDRLEELARSLGRELMVRDFNLVSGYGTGIGSAVIVGAMEALHKSSKGRQAGRTNLRPFPQPLHGKPVDKSFNTQYREDMISQSGAVIFLAGNKRDPSSNATIDASGMLEEFEIAKALKRSPVPIGVTGHVAEKLWTEVTNDLGTYFRAPSKVRPHFKILGNPSSTNQQLMDAVFAIIDVVNES